MTVLTPHVVMYPCWLFLRAQSCQATCTNQTVPALKKYPIGHEGVKGNNGSGYFWLKRVIIMIGSQIYPPEGLSKDP